MEIIWNGNDLKNGNDIEMEMIPEMVIRIKWKRHGLRLRWTHVDERGSAKRVRPQEIEPTDAILTPRAKKLVLFQPLCTRISSSDLIGLSPIQW